MTALDASTGKQLWRVRISPEDARTDTLGGGIAYGAGKVFVTGGYPEIPSGHYDVVVCEQVLEHLAALDIALATLVRVLRSGGRLVIGVPIFPPKT